MKRAITLLVFDHGLDPDTVEAMSVSRLSKYVGCAVELKKERAKESRTQ